MAIPYELIVEEDLNRGYGGVVVTMPAGGTAVGSKVGLHTFTDVFNVQDFGATGDGVTDDTAAIRAALAVVPATGGAIFFPAGTYLVRADPGNASLQTGAILPIATVNTRLFGVGRASVIQVGGASPAYTTIIGGTNWSATDLSGLEVDHLTFDHNIDANTIAGYATFNQQNTVRVGAGSVHVRVHDCEIRNGNSVNHVNINGPGCAFVWVTDNRFTNNGDDPNHTSHDVSVVYTHADHVVIAGNVFVSAGQDKGGAVTAIETHGAHYAIANNVIVDYLLGLNLTGIAVADSTDLVVIGNTMSGGCYGMQLWSAPYQTHTSGFGLNRVTVSGNTIGLAGLTAWPTRNPPGSAVSGIVLVRVVGELDATNLSIVDNVITHPLEVTPVVGSTSSLGIGWFPVDATRTLSHVRIAGNTILNFPFPAIALRCNLTDVQVENNQIINCGSTQDPANPPAQPGRLPVMITGTTLSGLVVRNNLFHDSLAEVTARPPYFLYINGGNAGGVVIIGNTFLSTGSAMTGFIRREVAATFDPYLDGVMATVDASVLIGKWRLGSHVLETTSGSVWNIKPDGVTWENATRFKRFIAGGTPLANTDAGLSGWGAGAAVLVVGTDQGFLLQITCGAGPSVNPTWTLTFKDGTFGGVLTAIVAMSGGDGTPPTELQWSAVNTTLTCAWIGTPVNTKIYQFSCLCLGR